MDRDEFGTKPIRWPNCLDLLVEYHLRLFSPCGAIRKLFPAIGGAAIRALRDSWSICRHQSVWHQQQHLRASGIGDVDRSTGQKRYPNCGVCGSKKRGWIKYLRSEEHTSELQSRPHLVCRLLL